MLLNPINGPQLLEERMLAKATIDHLLALVHERSIYDGATPSRKKSALIDVLKRWNSSELKRRKGLSNISEIVCREYEDGGGAAAINASLSKLASSKLIIHDDDDVGWASQSRKTTQRKINNDDEDVSFEESPAESRRVSSRMDLETVVADPDSGNSSKRKSKRKLKYFEDEAEGSGDENDHIGEEDDSSANEYELGPSVNEKGLIQFRDESGEEVVGFVNDEAPIIFEDADGNAVTSKAAAYGDVLESLKKMKQRAIGDVRSFQKQFNAFCVIIEEHFSEDSEDSNLTSAMQSTAKQLVKCENILRHTPLLTITQRILTLQVV